MSNRFLDYSGFTKLVINIEKNRKYNNRNEYTDYDINKYGGQRIVVEIRKHLWPFKMQIESDVQTKEDEVVQKHTHE